MCASGSWLETAFTALKIGKNPSKKSTFKHQRDSCHCHGCLLLNCIMWTNSA